MHQKMICAAIAERQVIELRYDKDIQFRKFNPHIVWKTDDGNVLLEGLQVLNPAKPLERNRWRRFALSDVKGLNVLKELFRIEPTFYPLNENYVGGIICVVPQYLHQNPLGNVGGVR